MGKRFNKNRLFHHKAFYAKPQTSSNKHCPLSGGSGRQSTEPEGPVAGLGLFSTHSISSLQK